MQRHLATAETQYTFRTIEPYPRTIEPSEWAKALPMGGHYTATIEVQFKFDDNRLFEQHVN